MDDNCSRIDYALKLGLHEWGQHGVAGPESNPKILYYFSDIGHTWVKDDDTPWCAAFLNWLLKKADLPHTGKLNARSFLQWGKKTDQPKIGDVVVLWRISKESAYGHCGLYVNQDENNIFILGGNQSNQVNIYPFPKYRLLEYRTVRTH
jgi:uncharacterized protein (TIGR02594 family)